MFDVWDLFGIWDLGFIWNLEFGIYLEFGIWDLGFIWNLEFGIWDFSLEISIVRKIRELEATRELAIITSFVPFFKTAVPIEGAGEESKAGTRGDPGFCG